MNKRYFFFAFFGLVVCSYFVSANIVAPVFDYRMLKWTMCNTYNLTEYNCDTWWESPTNPYYIENDNQNLTDYYNKTGVKKLLKENYYNKTQVLNLYTSEDLNFSGNIYNKTEIDKLFNVLKREWLMNMSDKYVEKEEYEDDNIQKSTNSGISDSTILIFLGFIIIGAVAFFIYTKKSKDTPDYNDNYGRIGNGRIHSKNTLDKKYKQLEAQDRINNKDQQEIKSAVEENIEEDGNDY